MAKRLIYPAWGQSGAEGTHLLMKEFETLSEAVRKDIRAELQRLVDDIRASIGPHSQRNQAGTCPMDFVNTPHFDEFSSSDEDLQGVHDTMTPPGEPDVLLEYDSESGDPPAPPPREAARQQGPRQHLKPLFVPGRLRSRDLVGTLAGGTSARSNVILPEVTSPNNVGPIRSSVGIVANLLNNSLHFNLVLGGGILLNSISIGMVADFEVNTPNEVERASSGLYMVLNIVDSVFLAAFSIELFARVAVNGASFFTMPGWAWNVFDFVVITSQVTEQIVSFIVSDTGNVNIVVLRVLRILALVRLLRVLRVVRFARMLGHFRVIVNSLLASFVALFWTLNLLVLLQYCMAVFFTQLTAQHIVDHPENVDDNDLLKKHFGGLLRSQLTLFKSVTGGLDWGDVVDLLGSEIGASAVAVFTCYVAFSQIAMMNVVTGVFVESVVSCHKKNGDKMVLRLMRGIFGKGKECVTWDDFQQRMAEPRFQNLLRSIELDPSDANRLFKLLDRDGSGSLDAMEFLNGVVRLKGPAKALDLAVVVEELLEQRKMVQELISALRPMPVVRQNVAMKSHTSDPSLPVEFLGEIV